MLFFLSLIFLVFLVLVLVIFLSFLNVSLVLTPKVLLSSIGTIWTSGRLVQFQFMLRFFENFM